MSRLRVFSLLTCLVLAGCGGGGGSGDLGSGTPRPGLPPGADPVTGLIPLDANTAGGVSSLSVIALGSADNAIRRGSATLRHETGGVDVTLNGVPVLADTRRVNGVWNNGSVALTPNTDLTPAAFRFAKIYNLTGSAGSGPVVLGVTGAAGSLPTSGTARYQGVGFIDGATLRGTAPFAASGVSTVDASFAGAGRVDVTIDSFSSGTAPFTQLAISGMALDRSASSFSGGTVTLRNGSTDTTAAVLGSGASTQASGNFFGNEVGGIFAGDGTDGTLSGGFLAR